MTSADTQTELEKEVSQSIIDCLNLEDISAEEIKPEESLFNDGLGLDSIDALEISVMLTKKYGFELRTNDPANKEIFASIRALSGYIAEHRNK